MIVGIAAVALGIQVPGTTEVTVYNQGLGFIKDIRTLHLSKGLQSVLVEDVAQMIDATSVGFKCLSNPGSVSVLEQNYRYDLISPQAILEKSVGKRLRLTRAIANKNETLEGVLLNSPTSVVSKEGGSEYSYNGLVIKADDGRIILSPDGEIDVLAVPEGLISKPSLVWQLESASEQNAKMELSYLTKGMSWTANYVLTLGDSGKGDLQGWVTLDNQSGTSFENAQLKLVAGDINVVASHKGQRYLYGASSRSGETTLEGRGFAESSLFEYHLYTLGRPATLHNKETKQLGLLEGSNIPIKKVVTFQSDASVYEPGQASEEMAASVMINFKNDKASSLGMPMPAGKIRLYQRDINDSLQFLGEDKIKHTPRDEKLSLEVGKAFDLKASHKQLSYKRTSQRSSVSTYQVEFRNRKLVAETVTFKESIGGQWKIIGNSNPYVKEDAGTAVFEVKLNPGEVKTIKYMIDAKW